MQLKKKKLQFAIKVRKIAEAISTHMLHIPRVVCQAHGQDQPEMGDNYFSVENHTSLVQASQIPVKPFKSTTKS